MRRWRRGWRASDASAAADRLRCWRRCLRRHRCLHVRRQQRRTDAAPLRNSSVGWAGGGGADRDRWRGDEQTDRQTEREPLAAAPDPKRATRAQHGRTINAGGPRQNIRASIPAPALRRPCVVLRRPFRSRRGLDRKKKIGVGRFSNTSHSKQHNHPAQTCLNGTQTL